ncbi:unnamed protein product [Rotaria magnacalcarata]|uniref:RNB domain-containing protein n=5 Tax=Rotaria magnacalcarata TaxID=392030 RepID=A0A819B8H8_9BILA|nr:unnamed protein product [Rotaria magnacalcarata]CAF3792478.1 unnamed protein product [Rotaria magnacalcarata]
MSNPPRFHYNQNYRGNSRSGKNASHQEQQTGNLHQNHSQPYIPGPQDGGFDTRAWGNYENYYPMQTQNNNTNSYYNNNNVQSRAGNQYSRPNNPQRKQPSSTPVVSCDQYLSEEQVLKDIATKKTIRGILRINAKQYTDAFISDPEDGPDFYIDNVRERNRALNLDDVAAEIKPKREWKVIPEYSALVENHIRAARNGNIPANDAQAKSMDNNQPQNSPTKRDNKRATINTLNQDNITLTDAIIEQIPTEYFQRTVKVVFLFRRRHSMKAAGLLRKMPDNNPNYALFSPMDSRIPRLMIPMNNCPPDFKDRPSDYEKSLFVARIVDIPADKKFASGELLESLGDADTLEAQSKAILMENDIRDEEFSNEVIKCLPLDQDKWSIPNEEFSKRLDLRNQCIFTIDPATARDLDDALSCERLENGCYRIGVHIADVSYFVQEQTPLDNEAAQRTTSVYLVERVIPMLPRLLCDRLCSLNPNEDRLTYSVIWTMNEEGEILDEQFARSIIRSCVKLSYEHAQDIIENPNKDFKAEDFPAISNNFSVNDITRTVSELYGISKILRSKRTGALTLNQPKLQYQIKTDSKMPMSFSVYQQKESNRLVEEYMLLANMQVARKLCSTDRIHDKVILRRHPAPNTTTLQNTIKMLTSSGVKLDGQSSNDISKAVQSVQDESAKKLLIHLLAKSMQLAIYCCASCVPDSNYSHYALNVNFYTHFTSPIRRYPDILVHRLLGAVLDYNDNLYQTPGALEQIAQLCNEKKMNAKTCSERSAELYLAVLIREYGTISDEAVIVGVKDESLDVYLFRIGVALRVGINNLPLDHPRTSYKKISNDQAGELTIYWKQNEPPQTIKQVLKPFDTVNVDIMSEFDTNMKRLKLTAQLRHPNAEKLTTLANLCTSTLPHLNIAVQQRQDFDPYAEY